MSFLLSFNNPLYLLPGAGVHDRWRGVPGVPRLSLLSRVFNTTAQVLLKKIITPCR